MKKGAYLLLDLAGKDLETGVTIADLVDNKQVLLISGVEIQGITLPDFFFHGTTEDGELYTQNNLYLSYYLSINTSTGLVQVATQA